MSDQRTLRIARAKRKQSAFRQRRALLHKYNTIPSFYSNINRRQQQQRGVRHNDNIVRGIRAHFAWKAVREQMQRDINLQAYRKQQRLKRRAHRQNWASLHDFKHPQLPDENPMYKTNPHAMSKEYREFKRNQLYEKYPGIGYPPMPIGRRPNDIYR